MIGPSPYLLQEAPCLKEAGPFPQNQHMRIFVFPFFLSYRHLLTVLASLAVVVSSATLCLAALEPDEIALVVPRGNRESIALARYYCKQRAVPESHVIEVELPPGEVLARKHWRRSARPEIREWLSKNDPDRKIRCLVTTWGVPLKIAKSKSDETAEAYLKYLEGERADRLERLGRITTMMNEIAGYKTPTQKGEGEEDSAIGFKKTQQRLEAAMKAAQAKLVALPADQRTGANARLQQLAIAAGGTQVLLQGIGQQLQNRKAAGNSPPAALREQFDVLRGRTSAFTEVKLLLDGRAPSYDRDSLVLIALESTGGLIASVQWLDEQLKTARKNETGASFDSELSLVLWPDGYELLRWQPNYLRPMFNGSQLPEAFPTLMVARIDAPTLKLAKGLIDTAIKVEKSGGLQGKVYLDARGLAKLEGPRLSPGSYPDYDRSLLVTAAGLKSLKDAEGNPRFEVVLNEQPELFIPGQCPDAALYCGWYSLAKYVDAFDWNEGAIAYHMASAEATTLKEIDSRVWCKKLLEDGVCATIGPVYEPYILAFPRPNEFMALLVRGDLPLVEVYYHSKPFNSWAMVLIGDPLYRPYAAE